MKILLVNKYHYYRGGAETQVLKLGELLKSKGHEVMHFSMHHPDNLKYEYSKFFAPYIDFPEEMRKGTISSKIKVAKRMLYSKEARDKFKAALDFFKPDVIHLHNIHKHLTISIIHEANKRKIPLVWTLHDYQLICPNYTMLSKGEICEKCKNKHYLSPIFQKCVKDSFSASVIATIEKISNDIQQIDNKISAYISPSKFLRNKFIEFGFDGSKINYLPNFYPVSKTKIKGNFKEKYFLYLGRLSFEKGVKTLCEAANNSGINVKIVGDGPLKEELSKKYSSSNIEFLGYKKGKELENLRKNAWFVVVPSEWYENNPFSIIESFADGVPVIGSNIGGIPELVKNHITGFLFNIKNVDKLKEIIILANSIKIKERNKLGKNAKELIKNNYNPERYYQKLINIYNIITKK